MLVSSLSLPPRLHQAKVRELALTNPQTPKKDSTWGCERELGALCVAIF